MAVGIMGISENHVIAHRVIALVLIVGMFAVFGAISVYGLVNPVATVQYIYTNSNPVNVNNTLYAYLGNGIATALTYPSYQSSNFGQIMGVAYPSQLAAVCGPSPQNDVGYPIMTQMWQIINGRMTSADLYWWHGFNLRQNLSALFFGVMSLEAIAWTFMWPMSTLGAYPWYYVPIKYVGINAFGLVRDLFVKIMVTLIVTQTIGVNVDVNIGVLCVLAFASRLLWAVFDMFVHMVGDPAIISLGVNTRGGHAITLNYARVTFLGALVAEMAWALIITFASTNFFIPVIPTLKTFSTFVPYPQNSQRWLAFGVTLATLTWFMVTRLWVLVAAWVPRDNKEKGENAVTTFNKATWFGNYSNFVIYMDYTWVIGICAGVFGTATQFYGTVATVGASCS